MKMQRNTVIAIVLSIAVVVLWDYWYYSRYKDTIDTNRIKAMQLKKQAGNAVPAPSAGSGAVQQQSYASVENKGESNIQVSQMLTAAGNQVPASVAVKPLDLAPNTMEKPAKFITVNTGYSEITVSTVGGVIKSYQLFKYKTENGSPVDIVDLKSPVLPLSLEFATPEVSKKINTAVFSSDAPDATTLSLQNPVFSVPLALSLDNGVSITKTLTFHYGSYLIDMDVAVNGPGVAGTTFGITWEGLGGEEGKAMSYIGPVVLIDDKRLADNPKEKEPQTHDGSVSWGGLTNKYYCSAFIPAAGKSKVTAHKMNEKEGVTLQLASGVPNRFSAYAGPKDQEELKKAGHDLIRMVNYGWFDILANPLFTALTWLNRFLGNFGAAIIVLTILVKLLFWPLSQSSFKSVEKMKKVQPEMKMLQERYKNDKMKMNEELIALYKKHEINPMAGCLPIILQIPVFVALYKVLLESIDLKGAPFVFWIHDLSTKDPYYVTPILMGISMFAQQKMSPSSTDPLQRKLMMAMPIVFTVMFINFPSGLVIYWLVNNLLSILQQYVLIVQNKKES
jgi:YidC/Oxa1 family membrane protein insertase